MLYAGIDKTLLDPRFLQADGVGSIGETLRYFVTSGGPLAGLVEAVALPQPVLIGASMAGAQLIVGASLLTGSWVRYGALLGAGISLSLALTSTWGVSPYYYGNDLPYFVGFLALAALGDGGALRLGAPASRGHNPERRAALVSGTGIAAGFAALLVLDRSRAVSMITGGGTHRIANAWGKRDRHPVTSIFGITNTLREPISRSIIGSDTEANCNTISLSTYGGNGNQRCAISSRRPGAELLCGRHRCRARQRWEHLPCL